MIAGLLGGNATCWVVDEHLLEEIETILVEIRAQWVVVVALPLRERWLEIGE